MMNFPLCYISFCCYDQIFELSFRVKGLDKLRVADASIMPTLISANLNATCIMIGEKAADLIQSERLLSRL